MTSAIMAVEPIQICLASMARKCKHEDHLLNLTSSRNMALHPREMAEVASLSRLSTKFMAHKIHMAETTTVVSRK